VINAWPTKYTAPSFNAGSSDISIEQLELAHEGMTRTK
jgi:phage tail-like protein